MKARRGQSVFVRPRSLCASLISTVFTINMKRSGFRPGSHSSVGLRTWRLEAGLLPRQMPFSLKTGLFVSAAISWQI